VARIRELRPTHSLQKIASILDSSLSAVDRICKKYSILPPENFSELQSERIAAAWTDEKKEQCSIDSKARMTPEVRAKISENSKKKWTEKEYKEKQSVGRASMPRVSNIQEILYSILDDLGVKYYREYVDRDNDPETVIGFYNFDCVVPRSDGRTLLIECNGDYWHSQDKAIRNDRSKNTYITKYHNDEYELKYLWEHEFLAQDRIKEVLKRWLGLAKFDIVDFDFGDCRITDDPNKDDVKLLLSKYHYLPFVAKGGKIFGLHHDDVLIGCCIFSPLVRQNVRTNGLKSEQCLELSRFCLHPCYQKKNLGSWFISRCLKRLSDDFKLIISYADTTYNHDGAIYKSLNFVQDGVVPSDYWYVDGDGFVMHKRKLYKHAVKMSMKEAEFAELKGYRKVFGSHKIRFIMER
jgi:GNAT superfamily N-acetyltransferase